MTCREAFVEKPSALPGCCAGLLRLGVLRWEARGVRAVYHSIGMCTRQAKEKRGGGEENAEVR